MGTWLNGDGLYIKYGTTRATVTTGGEFKTFGDTHEVEFTLTLANLAATTGIISDVVWLPDNAFIERVEVVATTAVTGVNAVLNVGLIDSDRTTTADEDGLIAALPTTSMDTVGETTVLYENTTYNGALVGTNCTAGPYLFCADYDTAAFTAGVVKIRVFYHLTA